MDIIRLFKPKASKRNLLFIAALVWTFAGGMLLMRGLSIAVNIRDSSLIKILLSLVCGGLFYLFLFSRVSLNHVRRIINLQNDTPCLFSFFNVKSYVLMAVMIASGILLRTSGIIPSEYLSLFYIIMGIPLVLSSFRFYYQGFFYGRNAISL